MILYTSFDEIPGRKGASRHIEVFARALGQAFPRVLLVTPAAADQPVVERYPGVDHLQIGCPDDNLVGRVRTFRAKLAALLRSRRFQIAHFRSPLEGWPLVDPDLRQGARLVYEVNGFPSIEWKYHYRALLRDDVLPRKLQFQEDTCLRAADHIITVSETNRQAIQLRGIDHTVPTVIPNGISPDAYPCPPARSESAGEFQVAYFGTFAAWQGVDRLVEAVALARREIPIQLVALGSSSRTRLDHLQREIVRLGAGSYVQLCPAGDQTEILQLLEASHLAAVPLLAVDRNTVQGCCPLKLLESMAAGCPVIAADLPVVRELAQPHHHFLPARAGDARNWKNVLVEAARNYERLHGMAAAARAHVLENFTWDRAVARLVSVYRELIDTSMSAD